MVKRTATFFNSVTTSSALITLGLVLAASFCTDVFAGQVKLAWDASIEPEVSGYRLYYGKASGDYTASVDVGNQTSHVVYGLEVGQRYYFAATAYSVNGAQSGFSNQVSAIVSADARDTFHESPREGSYESGIGLIRGWACNAASVEVEIDGGERLVTTSGTARGDTIAVCGTPYTGYGLTINWNEFGDGPHTLRVFADDVEFANVLFNITTLGSNFLEGFNAEYTLSDFPQPGRQTTLAWSEPHQNFVIVGHNAADSLAFYSNSTVVEPFNNSLAAFHESPREGSYESGIGLIHGWVCSASTVEVEIDGGERLATVSGTARGDTATVCGTIYTGYGLTFNWSELDDGPHLLRAFTDGVEFADIMFNVTTLGTNYLRDAPTSVYVLAGFPYLNTNTLVRWSEAHQNFVIVGFEE